MINISLAQTLFSSAGSVFVVLSVFFFLIFRKFRFAILTLLLANVLIWTAIVFPKTLIKLIEKLNIPESVLSFNNYYLGVGLGLLLFVIWFILSLLVAKPFKKKNVKQENSQTHEDTDEKSVNKDQDNTSVDDSLTTSNKE